MSSSQYRKKLRFGDVSSVNNGRSLNLAKAQTPTSMNEKFIQAVASMLPGEVEIPLCCCRVPENIEAGDEYSSQFCQAKDTIGLQVYNCGNAVEHQLLIRPHFRVPFIAVCESHRARMRSHQCCPTCGFFCVKGRFKVCNETEPPHLYHVGCENITGYCAHCGSDKVVEKDVNMERNLFEPFKIKARMNPFPSAHPFADASFSFQDQKIVRDQTYVVAESDYQISALLLSDKNEREAINKAVEQANKVFSNSIVDEYNFADAIKKNDLMLTILCLAKGISPNTRVASHSEMTENKPDQSGPFQTALNYAAFKGFGLLVYVLIEAQADVNLVDSEGCNALMYAIKEKHRQIALMLIGAETNLDTKDNSGDTALHFAAVQGDQEVVKALAVSCCRHDKVNLTDRGSFGCEAIKRRRAKLINAQDNGGWTPLMWAAENGHVEAVNILLFFGAKTGIKDLEGNIALHWAAMSNAEGLVIPLVNASEPGEIDCQNNYGDTSLILAIQRKFRSMAEYLIQKNANLALINNQGCSAQDVCQDVGDELTKSLIETRKFFNRTPNPSTHLPKGRIILADLSKGREPFPVPVINDVDSEKAPLDFRYVRSLVEKEKSIINRYTALEQTCSCDGDCSLGDCECKTRNYCGQFLYDMDGLLCKDYNFSRPETEIYECSEVCKCSATSCINRVAQKGSQCRLQVRKTINKSWGVFAADDIPFGSFICEYAGEILPDDQAERLEEDSYLFDLDCNTAADQLQPSFVIDAKRYGNVARFINHSCDPNVWPIRVYWDHEDKRAPHLCFYARKNINANEEICFDYGAKFWMIKGQIFSCLCGTKLCKYSSDKIKQFVESCKQHEHRMETENSL